MSSHAQELMNIYPRGRSGFNLVLDTENSISKVVDYPYDLLIEMNPTEQASLMLLIQQKPKQWRVLEWLEAMPSQSAFLFVTPKPPAQIRFKAAGVGAVRVWMYL